MHQILSNTLLLARVVERLKAIADESRVRLLAHLGQGPANVSTLCRELDMRQPSASKHLAILRAAGLLEVRREGTQAVYAIADDSVGELCDVVCGGVVRHLRRQQAALARELPPVSRSRKKVL